jgi:hypothetical protein
MNTRRRVAAVVAAIATAVGGTALLPTQADAVGSIPTVKVFLGAKAVHLSTSTIHAGRVRFRAHTPQGGHEMQLLRLHKGYQPAQLRKDVGQAFQGNLAAIRRLDHRVSWLGGAGTRPKHPGIYSVFLRAGTYFVVDQNGPGAARLRVVGTPRPRVGIVSSSTIVGNINDRFEAPRAIPHRGWTTFKDTSDEPHFLEFQRVKPGTTRAMVRKAIRSNGRPAFLLPGSTSTGTVSGGRHIQFHYNLPAGKYVILCFWPSDETGMPHAFMGMFRFVNLR